VHCIAEQDAAQDAIKVQGGVFETLPFACRNKSTTTGWRKLSRMGDPGKLAEYARDRPACEYPMLATGTSAASGCGDRLPSRIQKSSLARRKARSTGRTSSEPEWSGQNLAIGTGWFY
jgi:hypothetical protein